MGHEDRRDATNRAFSSGERADQNKVADARADKEFDRRKQLTELRQEWEVAQKAGDRTHADGVRERELELKTKWRQEDVQEGRRDTLTRAALSSDNRVAGRAAAMAQAQDIDIGTSGTLQGPQNAIKNLKQKLASMPSAPNADTVRVAGRGGPSVAIRKALAILSNPAITNPSSPPKSAYEAAQRRFVSALDQFPDSTSEEVVDAFLAEVARSPGLAETVAKIASKPSVRQVSGFTQNVHGDVYKDGKLYADSDADNYRSRVNALGEQAGGKIIPPDYDALSELTGQARNKHGNLFGGMSAKHYPRRAVMVQESASPLHRIPGLERDVLLEIVNASRKQ